MSERNEARVGSASLLPNAESVSGIVRYLVEWGERRDERYEAAVASDIIALLRHGSSGAGHPVREFVDAAELARRLGRSRDYVYAHKELLGGHPMSDGVRPRWTFDPAVASRNLAALSRRRDSPTPGESRSDAKRPRRRREHDADVPLLPIKRMG